MANLSSNIRRFAIHRTRDEIVPEELLIGFLFIASQ